MNDTYDVGHNTTLVEPAPGVLANDWDMEDPVITANLLSGPSHYTSFTFGSDGSFSYTPTPYWAGQDSFTYEAKDGTGSDTATVTISVLNEPPNAMDDSYEMLHDTIFLDGDAMANDWDMDDVSLSATLYSGPSHAISFSFYADGTFEYQPITGWAGQDSFVYAITDGIDIATATVTITVTNEPPHGESDEYWALDEAPLIVDAAEGVLANDWDMDGDSPLTAVLVTPPQHGTLNLNDDGSFEYDAMDGFDGADGFEYKVFDGIDYSPAVFVNLQVGRVAIKLWTPVIQPGGGINWELEEVTDQTTNLWVGDYVSLFGELVNGQGKMLTNTSWNVPGKVIKAWEANIDTATVIPLTAADTTGTSVDFYWVDGGNKPVTFTSKVDNLPAVTKSTSFTIDRPTLSPAPGVNTAIANVQANPGADPNNPGQPMMYVSLGNPFPGSSRQIGIEFTRGASTAPGTWSWIQTLSTDINLVDFNTTNMRKIGTGLDGALPYAIGASVHDTPFMGLAVDYTGATRDDQFQTYLMFTSIRPSAIPVPIRRVDWRWGFSAVNTTQGQNGWTVVTSNRSVDGVVDTTDHPVWVQNINSLDWNTD